MHAKSTCLHEGVSTNFSSLNAPDSPTQEGRFVFLFPKAMNKYTRPSADTVTLRMMINLWSTNKMM